MVQRKGGRFGIETNQTLKYNSTIQRLTHGGGEVYEWRESYFSADAIGISVPYSLDRHKCWELLASSSQIQQTPSFSSKSMAQKARLESNRQEKIEQFETKCQNKHKHIRRQYEKEQRKLKIEQEQTEDKEKAEAKSNNSLFEGSLHLKKNKRKNQEDISDPQEEEAPIVVLHENYSQVPLYNRINKKRELGTLEVYAPNREKIWKTNQFRQGDHYFTKGNPPPRNQKKKEFRDSVFL